jgi:hypothetical protein
LAISWSRDAAAIFFGAFLTLPTGVTTFAVAWYILFRFHTYTTLAKLTVIAGRVAIALGTTAHPSLFLLVAVGVAFIESATTTTATTAATAATAESCSTSNARKVWNTRAITDT